MTAVWMFVRSELRGRWRSWLLLAVLAGLLGGLVMAVAAEASRLGSQAFTSQLGIPPVPDIPLLALAIVVAGALVLAVAVAAVPGRSATRARPADVLRAE
jgi:ABC-type lipoprotein release transport system permease subunit